MISVNDEPVAVEKNVNDHDRGLHVVLINPETKKVEWSKVFDTYAKAEGFDYFVGNVEIPGGFIVAAACKDDCASHLSDVGKSWFRFMGSKEIDHLEYRQGFAFVGIFGKEDMTEKRASSLGEAVTISRVFYLDPNGDALEIVQTTEAAIEEENRLKREK